MALIPWSSFQNAHSSNGGKGLKDYIENWLTHLVSNNQQKIQIVQEVLVPPTSSAAAKGSDSDNISLTLRLLSIKNILDASGAAIRSGSVFGAVQLRPDTLTWLCHIAQNTGGYTNSASLRGGVISIFTLLVRRFPKESSKFGCIGEALRFSLEDASKWLCDPELMAANVISSPCAMLLNQTVEVMTMAGDASLSWLRPVGCCVAPVAQILKFFSLLQLDKDSPLRTSLNQLQIKACKAFSMVVEIHMITTSSSKCRAERGEDREAEEAIADAPSNVLKLVSRTSIVHDIFQSTYQSALDMSASASPWSVHRATQLVGDLTAAISNQNQNINKSLIGTVDTRDKESEEESTAPDQGALFPYPSVIEIRRVESLLGLLCCVLDCHHEYTQNNQMEGKTYPKFAPGSQDDSLALAETVVHLLKEVMCNLKLSLSKEALASSTCGSSLKDLRSASSDARKGCIAVAHSLFTSLPVWVVTDLQQHVLPKQIQEEESRAEITEMTVSSSQCWTLAVKLLATPLLFGSAYGASASALDDVSITTSAPLNSLPHQLFTKHILHYLCTALRTVSKYSYAVACDVLTAVEELLEKHCVEILQHHEDIPQLLLQAYLSYPKGIAPSSSKSKKSAAGSDSGNAYEWKLHVLTTLKSVFQFATRVQVGVGTGFSVHFVRDFIVEVCCSDLFLLHGALGNILPGHIPFLVAMLSPQLPSFAEEYAVVEESKDIDAALTHWRGFTSGNTTASPNFSMQIPPTSTETKNQSLFKLEKFRKECNHSVTKLLGSCEMSEPLVGLLHTITLSLVALIDVINMTIRNSGAAFTLEEISSHGLRVLICFLTDISGRQLLFEDDGAQLCGELDVVSRYLETDLLLLQQKQLESQVGASQLAFAQHLLEVFVHTCLCTLDSSFQLGTSFAKIIYEISYNELLKAIKCVLTLHVGDGGGGGGGTGVYSDEAVAGLLIEMKIPSTYDQAVQWKQTQTPAKIPLNNTSEVGGDHAVARQVVEKIMHTFLK